MPSPNLPIPNKCKIEQFRKLSVLGKQNVDHRPSHNAVDTRGIKEHLEHPNVQALASLYRTLSSFADFLGEYLFIEAEVRNFLSGWNYIPYERCQQSSWRQTLAKVSCKWELVMHIYMCMCMKKTKMFYTRKGLLQVRFLLARCSSLSGPL